MEEAESEMQWIEILSKFEILEAQSKSMLREGGRGWQGGPGAREPIWT